MNRFFLIILAISSCCISKAVKPDSIIVSGFVMDEFTRINMDSVRITLMETDSSIISVTYSSLSDGYTLKVPGGGKYIVKMNATGYQTTFQNLDIPNKEYHRWLIRKYQDLYIRKLQSHSIIQLKGAVVKATKIKMIMKGDTVIYNANAFLTERTSMLDQLIQRMPGFEIDKKGNITHNGEIVEDLLINGNKFFSGNPRIALENLPSYLVNKIKVYRKSSDMRYFMKDSLNADKYKKLVVDVNLKREYKESWIANAQTGYGSRERYLGKLFAMHYTDLTQFYLFANANNLNDKGAAKEGGNWEDVEPQEGRSNFKTGGLVFNWKQRETKMGCYTALTLSHSSTDDQQQASAITYLSGGDEYKRNKHQNRNHETNFNWFNHFIYPGKKIFLSIDPTINYNHASNIGNYYGASFDSLILEKYRGQALDSLFSPISSKKSQVSLIHTMNQLMSNNSNELELNWNSLSFIRSPYFGNTITLHLIASYNNSHYKEFSYNDVEYYKTNSKDFRNQYIRHPSNTYDYTASLDYSFDMGNHINMTIQYSYFQFYNNNSRQFYRLDQIGGWQPGFGSLPSTLDSLLNCLDIRNSFFSRQWKKDHQVGLNIRWEIAPSMNFSLNLPFLSNHHIIKDNRNNLYQRKDNDMNSFNPSIDLSNYKTTKQGKCQWELRYQLKSEQPDLNDLLDMTDTSLPLVIQKGNPNLKSTINHLLHWNIGQTKTRHQQNANLDFDYQLSKRSVAQSLIYNNSTGVSTYTPQNINGNWSTDLKLRWGRALDSLDHWRINTDLNPKFYNCSDYTSKIVGNMITSCRTSVRNLTIDENIKLSYQIKNTLISIFNHTKWNHITSSQQDFYNFNAWDICYGLELQKPLTEHIEMQTDMTMYHRCGYNDKTMNDHNFVWNSSLSYSLLKNNALIIKLQAHDLLHQLSNVRTVMDAMGRTETWYNTIPSYVMLHLIYRLNVLPKENK